MALSRISTPILNRAVFFEQSELHGKRSLKMAETPNAL